MVTAASSPAPGYTLTSKGALGGMNEIRFAAEGTTAAIWQILKEGKIGGRRPVKVPDPKLVDALRALGFSEMTGPTGIAIGFRAGAA